MVNKEIVDIFAKGALNFYFQIKGKTVCRSLYKCKGGRKKDLFIYPDISKNDVAYYVRREFKIPYEEEILFVRDTSFWNNKNQGLVITDWGIRERPDNDKYEINKISWEEVEKVECSKYGDYISILFYNSNGLQITVGTYDFFVTPEFDIDYSEREDEAKAKESFYQSLAKLFDKMAKVQKSPAQKMLNEYELLKSKGDEERAIQIAKDFRLQFNNSLSGEIASWFYYKKGNIKDAIKILDEDINALSSEIEANTKYASSILRNQNLIVRQQTERANFRKLKYQILRDNGNHLQARKDCLAIISDIPMEFLNEESKELQKCAEIDFKELEQNYVEHFFDLPYEERKLIVPVNSYTDLSQKAVSVLDIHNLPIVNFGIGHPKVNQLYVGHPYVANHYIPFENYELALLEDKIREFCQVMQFLGATEINIESINSSSSNKSVSINQKGSASLDYKLASGNADFNRDASSKFLEDISRSISLHQKFTPKNLPTLPSNLIWYPNEPTWHRIYDQRMQGGLDEHEERIETKKSQVVDKSELVQITAEMKKLIIQAKGNWEQSMEEKYEAHENAVLAIRVKFAPLESLQEKKSFNEEVNKVKGSLKGYFNTAKDKIKGAEQRILSIGKMLDNNEVEYLDELKACLEEDAEISPRERRLLNRIREKLGISEERAAELEASLMKPQLTEEEEEYLEEYKACLEEDGEITPKARRMLDRFRNRLGISEERALDIENY